MAPTSAIPADRCQLCTAPLDEAFEPSSSRTARFCGQCAETARRRANMAKCPRNVTGPISRHRRRPTMSTRNGAKAPDTQATTQEPEDGLEPTTYRLQGDCSTN